MTVMVGGIMASEWATLICHTSFLMLFRDFVFILRGETFITILNRDRKKRRKEREKSILSTQRHGSFSFPFFSFDIRIHTPLA